MLDEIGVQSYTYREFDADALPSVLESTPVSAVEVYPGHLGPDAEPARVDRLRDELQSVDVRICGIGVFNFERPTDVHEPLALADRVDATYVSAHVDRDDEHTFRELVAEAAARDLHIAIHNHGPGAMYSSVEDVSSVLDTYPDAMRLGACVDTGHFLRSDQPPVKTFPALSERIHAVHVKDFVDDETEVVPGDGQLDLSVLLGLLDEHMSASVPPVLEYEEDPQNPTPAVKTACDRLLS